MSTTVLATKLFAPALRPQRVMRSRLLEQLDTTLEAGHRLTVLSAPAGFGKTTVLGEWLQHLDRSPASVRVGWLSLDEDDNDLARLLTHLLAALQRADLEIDTGVIGTGLSPPSPNMLTPLVNALTAATDLRPDTQWVVVLDDYHAITDPDLNRAFAFLLDHLPPRLHLVLATRSDPLLPLARLRSRGQLTELRVADLRFTPAEAADFLNRVMGLGLTSADVTTLDERTEGWAAGLQLAALSLRGISGRDQVASFIAAFTGSSRFVLDYLADEVLARQPVRIRDFLLRTSLLDRLSGSLCDAVTGGTDGAQLLAELDRHNLFVVPLDHHGSWYRYHHLFGDVLRARLLATEPEQLSGLHRRASDWFAAHDLVGDAVRHALAAEDVERAAGLMEAALPDLRRARQDGLLLTWMRSLPEPVVRRRPVLCIVTAWSRLMTGDLAGVGSWLDAAEDALAAGVHDPATAATWADTEDLRTAPATIQIYRASLAQAEGDVGGTVRHARRALDLAAPEDHFIRGAGAGYLGLAAWAAGDLQEGLSTFSVAARSLRAAGNLVDALDATVVLADMWVAAGRPGRARRLYHQALATAEAADVPHLRAAADLHVGLAELDRDRGDLRGAEVHLETARTLGEQTSITENRYRWYVAAAQVHADRRDVAAALALLDQAEALFRPGFYPEVRPIPALRARVQLRAGNLAAAEDWAEEHEVTADGEATYLREYDLLTLVRLRLAQHRRDRDPERGGTHHRAVDEALALLDRLAAAAADRPGSLVEIGTLRALGHIERGDEARALAELEEALARAPEPEGCARLFLDEGGPMVALLERAAAGGGRSEGLVGHARRLLDLAGPVRATDAGPDTPRGAPGTLADPLSERELEVLRLLDSELTGPEIARRLYVSVNTLRTHTKRIYTKLDVTSRVAAVRRAGQLGLL